jgi:hypothetical protein
MNDRIPTPPRKPGSKHEGGQYRREPLDLSKAEMATRTQILQEDRMMRVGKALSEANSTVRLFK